MRIDLFRRYHAARPSFDVIGRIMPYGWTALPDPLEAVWMVYGMMLDDFAREISNAANAFTLNVRRLATWASLMGSMTDEERGEALFEFIEPVATLCLLTPYALRSRVIFATAHLSHQVNLVKEAGWSEASLPPDADLYFDSADRQGAPWRSYGRLKRRIEAIGGRALRDATDDFRNAFTHRFSPRVGTGVTNMVRRVVATGGRVSYAIGGTDPLDLDEVVGLLTGELDRCYEAIAAFQALVSEQFAYVAAENARAVAVRGATASAVE